MLKNFIAWVENQFPGSKEIIDQFTSNLTPAKILQAVGQALLEYESGKDFLTILKDALAALEAPDAPPAA